MAGHSALIAGAAGLRVPIIDFDVLGHSELIAGAAPHETYLIDSAGEIDIPVGNFMAQPPHETYLIDSGPLPVCHNQRAKRCRLYQDTGNAYWGYCAAKEEYYYGLKAHTVVTASGRPVEVLLLCGCSADLTGMKEMARALPLGSQVYADKAYTDYGYEEHLQTTRQITLLPLRKSKAKPQHAPELAKTIRRGRKRIETTLSQVTAKLPHRLRAVTPAGFESKVPALFVAFAICCAENEKQQTLDG